VLHVTCPNAEHPHHQAYKLDPEESGDHVRPGYTLESYKQLLEPLGFRIVDCVGIGGPVRQAINKRITGAQRIAGFGGGLLVFLAAAPFVPFDTSKPRVPYSLYVRAEKPTNQTAAQA
jgi:hypothetical protein